MPVPMIAPIPSSVRSKPDSVRLSPLPPCSASPTSCSIDFVFSRFESIQPPARTGAARKTAALYMKDFDELARAALRIAAQDVGDHRDRGRSRRRDLARVLERDAADRRDRLAAAGRAAH